MACFISPRNIPSSSCNKENVDLIELHVILDFIETSQYPHFPKVTLIELNHQFHYILMTKGWNFTSNYPMDSFIINCPSVSHQPWPWGVHFTEKHETYDQLSSKIWYPGSQWKSWKSHVYSVKWDADHTYRAFMNRIIPETPPEQTRKTCLIENHKTKEIHKEGGFTSINNYLQRSNHKPPHSAFTVNQTWRVLEDVWNSLHRYIICFHAVFFTRIFFYCLHFRSMKCTNLHMYYPMMIWT